MSSASRTALPIEGAELRPAGPDDGAELLVLQRCCWVEEAIANDMLDIAALHETLDDVRAWIDDWTTWCVRVGPRLVGAVRAKRVGDTWEIGRLMVAPDLSGRGLGRWLLQHAEGQAPAGVTTIELFTGVNSTRNIRMYQQAGYELTGAAAPARAVNLAKRLDR